MTEQEKTLARTLADRLLAEQLIYHFSDLNNVMEKIGGYGKYGIHVSLDGSTAKITMDGMYGDDFVDYDYDRNKPFTFETMKIVADLFGSKKVNVGSPEGLSGGCETCGHGGRHRVEIFVLDYKI